MTHLTKALLSFGRISYHWNRVLPVCWHLSLYGEMRPRFTSRYSTWISAMCYELFTLRFETCLVKSTSRLVIKRWFIEGVSFLLSFSNIWPKSTGLATRPAGEKILATKFRVIHWKTYVHVSLSFSCFSEIISWGIHRKTNSRFFTILGEGWIQLQNTSYFKCKMILL